MSQYTTEAVVLGTRNWGEADKIITLLSPEKGLIKAAAFGSRRPRSALAGNLQMFNQVEVQLQKGDKLDTVKNCSLLHANRDMSTDFTVMAYGSFVAETAGRLAIENFPQQQMYQRLLEIFSAFAGRNPRIAAEAAAYQLLEYSGMQLGYEYCAQCGCQMEGDGFFDYEAGGALCPKCADMGRLDPRKKLVQEYPAGVREFIRQLLQLDWHSRPAFSVKGRIMVAAEGLLLGYLHFIFEKPLKSLEFIRQIS